MVCHCSFQTNKKPIMRQRSVAPTSSRQKNRRVMKQISLPNERSQDQPLFYNQSNLSTKLNRRSIDLSKCTTSFFLLLDNYKQDPMTFTIKDEHMSSLDPMVESPTIELVSSLPVQETVSNSEIDQTIDDVINGKGDIRVDDLSHSQSRQQQRQPSSQLVWVQSGVVTTKTWLSPLCQKQQLQQSTYESIGSSLTHQDVVNIAQQVVFPTNTEQNQKLAGLQPQIESNTKKRNRSKSTNNTTPKRSRNAKITPNRPHSAAIASSQQEVTGTPTISPPITPTLNLINKLTPWSNIPASGSMITTKNTSTLNSDQYLLSFDKNDSWQTPCNENVDGVLDQFNLVSIDEQEVNSNHHFDFDLSTDAFSSKTNEQFCSSTPPPPLTTDNQRFNLSSTDKLINSAVNNPRLVTNNVDVYEHFLNPHSSSIWQENQVTSSVSTPPDSQTNNFSIQSQQQQYYSPQIHDEHFISSNLQSQVNLL